MLNNYQYFLVLAEELNISNAANRLFISHQCLSKYVKNLENKYGIAFFERKPKFMLTAAGEILLKTLREVEICERNAESQLADIKNSQAGTINFGITEGRYPLIIPRLTREYKKLYPKVDLIVHNTTSVKMQQMLLDNKIDLYLAGTSNIQLPHLAFTNYLNEELYVIISDNLLKNYFSDYPACKKRLKKQGFDFTEHPAIPFVINKPGFNSRDILDRHLHNIGVTVNCISELTNQYMQYRLSAEDYAATVSLTMFLPDILELNKINRSEKKASLLNIFPIKGLRDTNPSGIVYHQKKLFPQYTKDFCKILKKICLSFQ